MTRRLLQIGRIILLLALSVSTILVLFLRHRSPTLSDRLYRARNGRFVQLDSRDHRMRLIFIHDYPNDEPLSWRTDDLTGYIPGRAPVVIAPVPLLRLTPFNEESAGPLSASKGLADKKPYGGWGGVVMTSNKPPSNEYPSLSLHSPPATKPAEKLPKLEAANDFNLGANTLPASPPKPPEYIAGTATAMITRTGTPVRINGIEPGTSVVVANSSTLKFSGVASAPSPPAWPYRAYSLPHWTVALILGLYPLIFLTRFIQRRFLRWRRGKAILCLSCGYDIRATPDRCPECGTPGPSAIPAASTAPAPG